MNLLRCGVFRTIAFALCIGCSLNACSQGKRDYSGASEIRMYRHSEKDVVTLKIPNGYLDSFVLAGPAVAGAREDTAEIRYQMFFLAEAGTLKPRSSENNQVFIYPNYLTDEISFSFSTIYARPPKDVPSVLQSIYQSRANTFRFSCINPPKAKPRFALEWYAVDRTNCPKQSGFARDMLIDRNEHGAVQTMLFCTPDEVPDLAEQKKSGNLLSHNPRCEHLYYFEKMNASVTLNYARFYAKDWRLLEQRINALLLSFLQTPST